MSSSLFTQASVVAALTAFTAFTVLIAAQTASAQGVASVPTPPAAAVAPAALLAAATEGAHHKHSASPGELEALRGEYALSDARVLSVSPRARSLVADIGNGPAQRLYAVAHQVYRTSDGRLELSFCTDDNGQVSSVRVVQHVVR